MPYVCIMAQTNAVCIHHALKPMPYSPWVMVEPWRQWPPVQHEAIALTQPVTLTHAACHTLMQPVTLTQPVSLIHHG